MNGELLRMLPFACVGAVLICLVIVLCLTYLA